jgi:acylphosphatase
MKTIHVIVTGTVQGVGFRAAAVRVARSVGVAGWIRNLTDGSVEAVFSGAADAVDAAVDWCHTGPDEARVDSVAIDPVAPDQAAGLPDPFEVR